ncbi:MAG: hypothetical protein JNM93_10300 [Bacteriovoracaceae bacterium]|nr:hypothetical protein [Bacteriovoracaceae bacterium]
MPKKNNEILNLGLLGANIQHTQSPAIYQKLLDQKFHYHIIDISNSDKLPSLESIFEKYQLDGLSITSPFKRSFTKAINQSSINCVKQVDGKIQATSTDYSAMKKLLETKYRPRQIVILGDGAMAILLKQICQELKISYLEFSRKQNGEINKLDLSALEAGSLVINSCSRAFVFEGKLSKSSIFWDLNYHFLPHIEYFSKNPNWTYHDGMEVLELQCQLSLKFWDLS